MDIRITETAARQVQRYLARHDGARGLRLDVKRTGCSGLSYVLEITDSIGPEDQVFESRGVPIIVPRPSLPVLGGTTVDYVREGLNEHFVFDNPNAKGECGCGESFNI